MSHSYAGRGDDGQQEYCQFYSFPFPVRWEAGALKLQVRLWVPRIPWHEISLLSSTTSQRSRVLSGRGLRRSLSPGRPGCCLAWGYLGSELVTPSLSASRWLSSCR